MALDKDIAQSLIDDFVIANDSELNTIANENPILFDATLNALNFLSSRFGTAQKVEIVAKPKEVVEKETLLPFKQGDYFFVKEENNRLYEIVDLDIDNGAVGVQPVDNRNAAWVYFQIGDAQHYVTIGDWLLFKNGGKLQTTNNKVNKIYDFWVDNDLVFVQEEEGALGTEHTFLIGDALDRFKSRVWKLITNRQESETFPYKVGDLFAIPQTQLRFTIDTINAVSVGIKYEDGLTSLIDIPSFLDGVKSGYYRKIDIMQEVKQPTKTRKTATKEEKQIKKLQKEIDGLEVLAEVDDEAKTELAIKKQELSALKSKI